MAAPLALAAAPAIPALSRDITGVLDTAIAAIVARPEIIAMFLGSVPVMAMMPYIALMIQWNLEHLKFETVNALGNPYYRVTSAGKLYEGKRVLGTNTVIKRVDFPQREQGHSLMPPLLSNMLETSEVAQANMHKMLDSGGSFFDLIGGLFKQFTPPTPEV